MEITRLKFSFFVILIPIIYFNADISPLKIELHYSRFFANQNILRFVETGYNFFFFFLPIY